MLIYAVATCVVIWLVSTWWKNRQFYDKLKWINKAPGLPILGNALDFKDPTKSLGALEKLLKGSNGLCYMELLTRPFILISDYNFLEWLLSSTSMLTKSMDYQFLSNWLEDGLLISDGEKWKKSRKILTPTFHFSILEEFVKKFNKPASILVALLDKEVGKDCVNVEKFLTNYTLDVICETAMGVEINAQNNPDSEYVEAVNGLCRIVVERAFKPYKTNDLMYMFTWDFFKEKKFVKYLHSVSNSVIRKRRLEFEETRNAKDDLGIKKKVAFLDLLLQSKDENGEPQSDKFIREEVDTIMFAGHDTTAAALCFILHCLSNHPQEQEKVYKEIKDLLHGKETVLYSDLQELKYMDLVVKECLRLYPSVPFYSRRTVKYVVYDGNKVIPKDVTLLIAAFVINRNPNVYKKPDKFRPERFLEEDIKPYSYLPFSAGPRNCIGQKFALLSIKTTLVKLLSSYELEPVVPEHQPILSAESILRSKNGFKMRLKRRLI